MTDDSEMVAAALRGYATELTRSDCPGLARRARTLAQEVDDGLWVRIPGVAHARHAEAVAR